MARENGFEFIDDVAKLESDVEKCVFDWTIKAEIVSKETYAPRGATGDLIGGIKGLPPVKEGTLIIGVIQSTAIDADTGEDYARKQHDENLRHIADPPAFKSFADLGFTGTTFSRYEQGYAAAVQAGNFTRFEAQYLDKAVEEIEPDFFADCRVRIGRR